MLHQWTTSRPSSQPGNRRQHRMLHRWTTSRPSSQPGNSVNTACSIGGQRQDPHHSQATGVNPACSIGGGHQWSILRPSPHPNSRRQLSMLRQCRAPRELRQWRSLRELRQWRSSRELRRWRASRELRQWRSSRELRQWRASRVLRQWRASRELRQWRSAEHQDPHLNHPEGISSAAHRCAHATCGSSSVPDRNRPVWTKIPAGPCNALTPVGGAESTVAPESRLYARSNGWPLHAWETRVRL